MYTLKYKNTYPQRTIGWGVTGNFYAGPLTTGGANQKGMDYGVQEKMQHLKLFGVEDLYGGNNDAMDGLEVDSSYNLWVATDNFNDSREGYIKVGAVGDGKNGVSGWLRRPKGNNTLGFIPEETIPWTSGDTISKTKHFCSPVSISGDRRLAFGGGYYDGEGDMNVYSYKAYFVTENPDQILGARLTYFN